MRALFLKCAVSGWILALLPGPACMRAADTPDCLAVQDVSIQDHIWLRGSLTNNCSKPVTAYVVTVELFYEGGRQKPFNLEQDLLIGLAGGVRDKGLQPGQKTPFPEWSLSSSRASATSAEVAVSSVIFDDATAVGVDVTIEATFARRQVLLAELNFWNDEFRRATPRLQRGGNIASFADKGVEWRRADSLAGGAGTRNELRTRSADTPADLRRKIERANTRENVRSAAEMIRGMAAGMDFSITEGKISRQDGLQAFGQRLSRMVDTYTNNSRRSTR